MKSHDEIYGDKRKKALNDALIILFSSTIVTKHYLQLAWSSQLPFHKRKKKNTDTKMVSSIKSWIFWKWGKKMHSPLPMARQKQESIKACYPWPTEINKLFQHLVRTLKSDSELSFTCVALFFFFSIMHMFWMVHFLLTSKSFVTSINTLLKQFQAPNFLQNGMKHCKKKNSNEFL